MSSGVISKRKKVWSWALYDWANSTYSTTVSAGFFPLFFKKFWSSGVDVHVTTQRLGVAISIASLMVAIVSPTLGVLSDKRSSKKKMCFLFMLLGAGSCAWMGFIPEGDWAQAMVAYCLAMFGFTASCNFYDSLLPSVAEGQEMDHASALGYSMGYLGGGILFAINVAMFLKPDFFGLANGAQAVQVSFIIVAIWWILFSLPMMFFVPEPKVMESKDNIIQMTKDSIVELRATFGRMLQNRNLTMFMVAFWLYIDGVYTVMTMAVDLGSSLGFESQDLIKALLITQFVGFPAAYAYGFLAKKFGSIKPLLFGIGVYAVTCILATQINQAWHFYALATVIGLVQGGVQSLSRSLFGQMIPKEQSGEYFGLFNVIGKFASVVGPLLVAVAVNLTGNSRYGMLGLIILFAAGAILLSRTQVPARAP